MAHVKYFGTCSGETVELINAGYADRKHDFERLIGRAMIAGEKMVRDCQLFAVGTCPLCNQVHVAERRIFRPDNSKNHKCSGICLNAKGGNCECACGGKNHGKAA